jgi:hypothetical protein
MNTIRRTMMLVAGCFAVTALDVHLSGEAPGVQTASEPLSKTLTRSPGPSAPKPLKNLRRKPWRQNERKPQQQSSLPNSR